MIRLNAQTGNAEAWTRTGVELDRLEHADTDDSGMILGFLMRRPRVGRWETRVLRHPVSEIDEWQWRDLGEAEWIDFDHHHAAESK